MTADDGPAVQGTSVKPPMTRGRFWRTVFLQHKLLLIIMATIGAGVGHLAYKRIPPVYASAAQLLVAENQVRLPVEGAAPTTMVEDPIPTHLALMRTPVILRKALKKLEEVELQVPASPGVIASGLSAVRSEGSDEIMHLSYQGANRYDCQKILSAVVQAYIDFVYESQQKLNEQTINLINQAKDELFTTLVHKEREYAAFRDEARLLWDGEIGRNKHEERVRQIEAELSRLQLEKTRVRAEQKALQEAVARGESREALLLTVSRQLDRSPANPQGQGADGSNITLAGAVFPKMIDEQSLLQNYGPNHPLVLAQRRQIEELSDGSSSEPSDPQDTGARRADPLEVYLASLTQELAILDEKEAEYQRLAATEGEMARVVGADENKSRALREDIERTKGLYDDLLDRLQKFDLVKDGDFLAVEMVAPPGVGYQVSPEYSRMLTLGALLGLLAGVLLAIFDTNVRYTAEEWFASNAPESVSHARAASTGESPRPAGADASTGGTTGPPGGAT